MKRRRILVTGHSGLVGSALCAHLISDGLEVVTVSRAENADFTWDVKNGFLDPLAFEEVDAVVHLAGENVAQRWSKSVKNRILESRIEGTELLVRRFIESKSDAVFISASGINFYGYAPGSEVDESSSQGEGFLAEVCRRWEMALQPLETAGNRWIALRIGVVLSDKGGALAKMLPPFRAGLGGPIGSGVQKMSWITIRDLVRVICECISSEQFRGPLNAVAPNHIENRLFSDALGSALGRPSGLSLPSFAAKLMFGEMARETLLADLPVRPTKLIEGGFDWESPVIESAMKEVFSK